MAFANNAIWSCFLLFSLIIYLYFSIITIIAQIFISIAVIAAIAGIPVKEEKAKKETHPVAVEAKISKCSI